jgi:hypothetical protein
MTETAAPSPSPTAAAVVAAATPSDAPTLSPSATATAAPTAEPSPVPIAPVIDENVSGDRNGLTTELLVGLAGLAALGVYAIYFWRGLVALERYKDGFVITRCPVCLQGDLTVETRRERFIGVPRARRTVHCSHCRSMLREAGRGQWRYAVDPLDNPAFYNRLNGQVLDEDALILLAARPPGGTPSARLPQRPPRFVDDEEQP